VTQIESTYNALIEQGSIKNDPAQKQVIQELQKLEEELCIYERSQEKGFLTKLLSPTLPTPTGLYIFGEVGRGKSMVMDLFFENSTTIKKRRVHFHAFMIEVHEELHKIRNTKQATKDPIFKIAKKIADNSLLLCLDEFHVTDITDAMIIGRLFSALFDEGVIIVATSNRAPDNLYQDGLQRENFLPFIEILKQKTKTLELASPTDYRLDRIKSIATVYYIPLDNGADEFIKDSFAQLTNNAKIESADIHVKGRIITLNYTHNDVALVSFEEMCTKPLGAEDYLEIAMEFTTILISGIPVMNAEKRNEAKRFVTFIDTLYEHNTKIICTAGESPQNLYTEGSGAFEFQRTVSRLMEMQSQDYWHSQHQ
jgi:cell division protein ZapE